MENVVTLLALEARNERAKGVHDGFELIGCEIFPFVVVNNGVHLPLVADRGFGSLVEVDLARGELLDEGLLFRKSADVPAVRRYLPNCLTALGSKSLRVY
jgi:hypothetical protein